MKYFVRSNPDAPEKGPYTRDQVEKSWERGLLGTAATARVDGSDDWRPLREFFGTQEQVRAAKQPDVSLHDGDREMHAAAERARAQSSTTLKIGLAALGAGVVMSAVSFAGSSAGGGILFTGLIAYGIVMTIRGLGSRG